MRHGAMVTWWQGKLLWCHWCSKRNNAESSWKPGDMDSITHHCISSQRLHNVFTTFHYVLWSSMIFNDLCICCDCLLLLLHLFSVLPLFPSQKLKVNKLHNIVLSVVTGDHRKLTNQITAHHGEIWWMWWNQDKDVPWWAPVQLQLCLVLTDVAAHLPRHRAGWVRSGDRMLSWDVRGLAWRLTK